MTATLLLTGFEPYGGHPVNPSAEIVYALDGDGIAGARVVARVLPVSLDGLRGRVAALLAEHQPIAVISLGLAPGTPVIRLERVALNRADFNIPDNSGRSARDEPLVDGGPDALFATLPLALIQTALLTAGLPAQLSDSAGTYLCNAVSYEFLYALRERRSAVPCGFVHLPYLPQQVADAIRHGELGHSTEHGDGRASMGLAAQTDAVRIALDCSARAAAAAPAATTGGDRNKPT